MAAAVQTAIAANHPAAILRTDDLSIAYRPTVAVLPSSEYDEK